MLSIIFKLEAQWLYVLKWARCLPNRGTLLSHHGQAACPGWAELVSDTCPIHSYFQSSANACNSCHLTIPLISKPSRQLADNREIVNCLFVRILQQKTRWSDSFFAILGFTENQATFTTFTHIYQHRSIPPTGILKISLSTKSYSPLGFDKIITLGNVNKLSFLSLNRIFGLSVNKISGISTIKMKVFSLSFCIALGLHYLCSK